ncbi:hypothetical protein JZ751_027112 [Albula glossodonta]|uniref:Coiled-coil domain-containing protein 73 n=1 Tax=Albula glossodonta TaxID=121402 RepID=A0A8T2NFS3_9TELE|nr:hypothetical protein JZ751_027112 [Albula glossodonta]
MQDSGLRFEEQIDKLVVEKQELQWEKDVEKVNIELIKSRMSSVSESRQEIHHHKEKEQQMQKLQHRLHVEAINSLQEVQKLLQIQTEALCQAELELSTQREEYQALKREHKLFREMIKKKEGQIESLTEEQNVSKTKWRNEDDLMELKKNNKKLKNKSSNVSPTGPGEIESNKCSQQDYCRVIAKQACCVYTPECSDTERTGEGRCVVNHNNMLLQTLESPRTLTGLQAKGAMTGDTADALGVCDTDAVQETDSSEHKSHGCESLPANGRPDKGSPPSVNMCNKGNFSGELNGPKSEPVNGTDSDPVGEVMKDRKQKETGCIPKTVMQIIDKCDRGSQRMTGFECAGRVEAEVFEADLKEDSPAIKTAADMLNTSSIHLRHRRNLREEWNAIAQTFCETSAELNTQVAYVQQHTGSSSLAPSSVEISTPPANFLPRQASQSRCMKEQDVPKTGSDGFLTSSEEQQSGQFPDERDTDVSVFRG